MAQTMLEHRILEPPRPGVRRVGTAAPSFDPRDTRVLSGAALGMVIHELRQPLSSLCNVVSVLAAAEPEGDEERRQLFEILRSSVDQLVKLSADMGEMSRLALEGVIRLRPEPTDLAALMRLVLVEWTPRLRHKRQDLSLRLPEVPVRLEADPNRLHQILGNLLDNACKYTPAGGRIAVSAAIEDGHVVVEVSDSGCGLDPSDFESIFDLFGRGSQDQEGFGVGLFLVKRLVELHGGSLQATSEGRGKGSTFVVRLPVTGPAGMPVEA